MDIDDVTLEELKDLGINPEEIEELDEYKEYNNMLYGTPYVFGYVGLQRKVKKGNSEELKTLSNFMPIPTKKIYIDNGLEVEGFLEIAAVLNNKIRLNPVKVNYNKLENMSWIFNPTWDLLPQIYPPKSNHKEYVYAVIQNLSKDINKETIYEHTGFRKVNGKLVYLHQGGAIGDNKDIKVDLSEINLERYKFTDNKYDLNESIKTSLSILDLSKKEITIPLLALTYLSPLRSLFLEENIPLGFVTWIVGESGSQKSSLSSIMVSHFGDFERDTLPGGFKDTVNSIEKKSFTLKDTLFAIDDYYPSQTLQEGKKMDAVAESLFGLYGDRQARSRMKQDGQTVKMGFSARGMCIVTGESFPSMAESRTARALIIEMARRDIDLQLLSKLQERKDQLSFCMKEFIQYIIENYKEIKKNCKSKFIEYRNKANQDFAHGRIPEIIASEYMGIELFYEFAYSKHAIEFEEMNKLKLMSWDNLIKTAQKQSVKTEENRTDNMFFRGVQGLLLSKKIYLKNYKNNQREPDIPLSTFVGYYDEERQRCYLLPDVIYNEIVKFYAMQGIKFPGNAGSTWKYLKEAGRLFPGEKDRNKTRKSINGKMVTFIEVLAVDVFGEEERKFGDYLNKFPVTPENHSKNISIDDVELPF